MQCVCLCVKYEAALVPAVGGLCEQQGFGVDHELCQGMVAVDYRSQCPSVLNKGMSGIKRQCSPVCCKLGRTPHIRDSREAQELQADMMDKSIDSAASREAPCPLLRLDSDATSNLAAAEGDALLKTFTCVAINCPSSFYVRE